MRRLTLALLLATYFCLSLIVALTLWRNGAGWGVAVSSMIGCVGLCLASHGMIMRFLEMRDMKGEVEAVRDAHRILLGQVLSLDGRRAFLTGGYLLTGGWDGITVVDLENRATREVSVPDGPLDIALLARPTG